MIVPTPRDVAHARAAAQLERSLDALVHATHVNEWNRQIEQTVRDLDRIARDGTGALVEFSYTDNVIRALPEPRLRPGSAALFDLDTGTHSYRQINHDQIGRTP